MREAVISVDPGTEKAGIAVVSRTRGTLERHVVNISECAQKALELAQRYSVDTVVMGDRTGCEPLIRALTEPACLGPGLRIVRVDEHRSSLEARERYLRANPGRGLARLLPLGLRCPDRAYDDYVAEILAERYFSRSTK